MHTCLISVRGGAGALIVIDDRFIEGSTNAVQSRVIQDALARIEALTEQNRQLIDDVKQLRAAVESFGMSKICPVNVTDVTEDNGMVCGAGEKNPAMAGSLAHGTQALRRDFENFVNGRCMIDLGFVTEEQAGNVLGLTGVAGAFAVRYYTLMFNTKDGEVCAVLGIDTNQGNPDAKTYFGIQIAVTNWTKFILRRCINAVWTEWETIK